MMPIGFLSLANPDSMILEDFPAWMRKIMNIVFSGWSVAGDSWEGYCWSVPFTDGTHAALEELKRCIKAEVEAHALLEMWADQDAIAEEAQSILDRPSGVDVWLAEGRWPKRTDKPVLKIALQELNNPISLVEDVLRHAEAKIRLAAQTTSQPSRQQS